MCLEYDMFSRRSFWSWFDVNRSTFDEDMCKKNDFFYIFVPSDLRLSAPLVIVVKRYVSTKLEVSAAFLFRENGGTGWTDRRTDGRGATPNVAPSGGPRKYQFMNV